MDLFTLEYLVQATDVDVLFHAFTVKVKKQVVSGLLLASFSLRALSRWRSACSSLNLLLSQPPQLPCISSLAVGTGRAVFPNLGSRWHFF